MQKKHVKCIVYSVGIKSLHLCVMTDISPVLPNWKDAQPTHTSDTTVVLTQSSAQLGGYFFWFSSKQVMNSETAVSSRTLRNTTEFRKNSLSQTHSIPVFFLGFRTNGYVGLSFKKVLSFLHLGRRFELKEVSSEYVILSMYFGMQFWYVLALHNGWIEVLETLWHKCARPWLQSDILPLLLLPLLHIYPLLLFSKDLKLPHFFEAIGH